MSNFQYRKRNLVVNCNSRVLLYLRTKFSSDVHRAVFASSKIKILLKREMYLYVIEQLLLGGMVEGPLARFMRSLEHRIVVDFHEEVGRATSADVGTIRPVLSEKGFDRVDFLPADILLRRRCNHSQFGKT